MITIAVFNLISDMCCSFRDLLALKSLLDELTFKDQLRSLTKVTFKLTTGDFLFAFLCIGTYRFRRNTHQQPQRFLTTRAFQLSVTSLEFHQGLIMPSDISNVEYFVMVYVAS